MDRWTRAFRRKLAKLDESGDIEAIARAFADSISGRKRYCVLVGALATVLEHNVGPETVLEFKGQLHQESLSAAGAFQAILPSLTDEDAYATLAMLLMAASGMWPHCHPAPVVREILKKPEFTPMKFDFKEMVQEHTRLVLRGRLA